MKPVFVIYGDVILPWPPTGLSPNSRLHWAKIAKLKKAYRTECWELCKASKLSAPTEGPVFLEILFIPPSKRKYDLDNCLASIKAGLDGVADAVQVDDSRFVLSIAKSQNIGGMVKITIRG